MRWQPCKVWPKMELQTVGGTRCARFSCNLIIGTKRLLKISKNKETRISRVNGIAKHLAFMRREWRPNQLIQSCERLCCAIVLPAISNSVWSWFIDMILETYVLMKQRIMDRYFVTALQRWPPIPFAQRHTTDLLLRFSHSSVWMKLWTVAIGVFPTIARIKVCKMSKHALKEQRSRRKKKNGNAWSAYGRKKKVNED